MPFGTTLREIVYDVAAALPPTAPHGNNGFKAVQIGGPSGGCLTKEHLDLPLDFDSLKKVGAMVGSGGLVVMNNRTCMVSVARFFMQFTQSESCGKCVLCREGTKQMLALLDDIIEGRATEETLDTAGGTCHHGAEGLPLRPRQDRPQSGPLHAAPLPGEYEAHVRDK